MWYRRNPDAFGTQGQGPTTPAYSLSQPVLADPGLSAALLQSLRFTLGEDSVVEGLNASADSFYSSQVGVCFITGCFRTAHALMHCIGTMCSNTNKITKQHH